MIDVYTMIRSHFSYYIPYSLLYYSNYTAAYLKHFSYAFKAYIIEDLWSDLTRFVFQSNTEKWYETWKQENMIIQCLWCIFD